MGLDMFVCERRTLTLSTIGCAKLYISANGPKRPEPYEGRAACRACPVGAFHATGKPISPISALTEALRMLCPRCGRPASRLIWGTLCASCDARQREAIARKNAKGTVPALSAQLHTQRIAVSAANASPHVVVRRGVASMPEVIIHHSKSATTTTAYGRQRVQWDNIRQLEMGL